MQFIGCFLLGLNCVRRRKNYLSEAISSLLGIFKKKTAESSRTFIVDENKENNSHLFKNQKLCILLLVVMNPGPHLA